MNPQPVPETNIIALPPAAPATPAFTAEFKHGGKTYLLYKQEKTKDGAYYVRAQFEGRRVKYSTKSNNAGVAAQRAKEWLDGQLNKKWEKLDTLAHRRTAATLGEVLEIYQATAPINPATIKINVWTVGRILRYVHGEGCKTDDLSLTVINSTTADKFQQALLKKAAAGAGSDAGEQTAAREKALRSSKSMVLQARTIFTPELVGRYEAAGLVIPQCVQAFRASKLRGSLAKRAYYPTSDAVIEKVFADVETLREQDQDCFLAFWFAVGAGLRRKEIQRLRWEHVIERDGRLWVSGGIGKDKQVINVWIQQKALPAITPLRKPEGKVLGELGLEWAKRLNWFMKSRGWSTEKKLHDLRAWVGGQIYRIDPKAAQAFLRHKHLRITEQYYGHYFGTAQPVDY